VIDGEGDMVRDAMRLDDGLAGRSFAWRSLST
jgi:hypothetical protein